MEILKVSNLKKIYHTEKKELLARIRALTREEEGIGLCAGAYLGGKKTAILMQNSGLGNSINHCLS